MYERKAVQSGRKISRGRGDVDVQEPKCSYLCDTFSAGGKALLEGGQEYRNTFRLQEVRRMSQKTVSPRWPTRIVCIQRMGGYRLTTCWCPNEKDELS